MNPVEVPQSNLMIEPASNQRKKIIPISMIVVVVLGLILSILTQPFASDENPPPSGSAAQVSDSVERGEDQAAQPLERAKDQQKNVNVTGGLAWIGQILVSFIALVTSISELAGVKVREIFSSTRAKTNVEEFPFHIFQDYNALLDYLFPDPKVSLISDRKITYLPQIRDETDAAFQQRGLLLIRGRSKTGKTREACELLRRWWYLGPTVLVARSHVGLKPPFKIPANLPTRNLVLFFDDIDRYLGDSASLKRLEETLQFFQAICHDRGEVRVIATARQEEEFWRRLGFDKTQSPWIQFELVQLEPLSPEKAQEVIAGLAQTAEIEIAPDLVKTLAEKNDGTFLNLALAFRGWLSREIKTLSAEDVRLFEGALKSTWRRRYGELAEAHPAVKPVYAAIDFLQSRNLPLRPALITELAAEMSMRKTALSILGWFDHLQAWADRSPSLNWYRDPKTRARGWVLIGVAGLVLHYLLAFAFLRFIPGNIQDRFFETLAENFNVQLLCLAPLWILLVPFAVFLLANAARGLAHNRAHKALEFLLATEVPTRGSELRPYENQFEGNGSTQNWDLRCYTGEVHERRLSQRLANRCLSLAEQLRLNGEFSAARTLASTALQVSPGSPAVLFLLGKIAFGEERYQKAIDHFADSLAGYHRSNNACHVLESMALSYLYLGDHPAAETAAQKALEGMPGLLTARWVLGLAQLNQDKISAGEQNCRLAIAARQPVPADLQKALEATGAAQELRASAIADASARRRGSNGRKASGRGLAAFIAVMVLSVAFILLIPFISKQFEQEETTLRLTNGLLTIFPGSPCTTLQRGKAYYDLGNYEKAVAEYTDAIHIDSTYTNAYNGRGNAYEELGEYENAIADYTAAIRIDDKFSNAYSGRGWVYYELGEYDKALADYTEVIRINPESAGAYNARGNFYYNIGEYEQAITDYTAAIHTNPKYKWAYFNRGDAHKQLNQYDSAIADYAQAIRIDPNYVDPYIGRGDTYYAMGEHELALTAYTEAIRVNPKFINAYNGRGWVYYELGEYDKALAEYNTAIRMDPKSAWIYNSRGNFYYNIKKFDMAIADYTTAIQTDAKYKQAYFNRGDAHKKLGEYDKAIADYTQAIRMDPKYVDPYIGRGDTYYTMGEHELALAEYTAAIRIDPKNAWVYNTRGNFYYNIDEYEQAVVDYTAAIHNDPKYKRAYFNRGDAHKQLSQYDSAIADYTEAIRIDPNYVDPYISRGDTCYLMGEQEKALSDFAEAIRIDPKSTRAFNTRGTMYYNLGEYDRAIADYTEALRADPLYKRAYLNRGDAYKKLNKFEQAVTDYTEAIRIDSKYTNAYTGRGWAYFKLGKHGKALADYTEAIRLDPESALVYNNRGNFFYNTKEYEKAVADYTEAVRNDPKYTAAYFNRGDAYTKLGDYDRAIADYTEAIRIDPRYADPYNGRARAYKALGKETEAAADQQKYKELTQ